MRSDRYKNQKETCDFEGMKYSPELIRQLSDPEYAKAEEQYAREAKRRKNGQNRRRTGGDYPIVDSRSAHRGGYEEAGGRRAKAKAASAASKGGKKKKYRFRPWKLVRNIVALLLVLLVVFTGVFYALTGNFDRVDTEKSAFAIDPQVADDLSGYRNIAILGSDARADEGYDGSRTDAIIIMSIKKSTGEIKLISVMRDSYLKMDYFDGTSVLDKVTHAHHYLGGVNTCASLNQSLDLNIEEFVVFNWKSVADAVDCLGGIEINVSEDEMGDMNIWGNETAANVGREYTPITETGKQTLDGVQATTYCRIRKNSGGDEGRSKRYKEVVAATMKKAMLQPWKLAELSETVFPQIRTNMSRTEMYTAVINGPRYDMGSSISWPKDYWAGYLGDISYVVPTTLESNVQWLHKKAFGQDNYQVSDTCSQINQEISWDTGVY